MFKLRPFSATYSRIPASRIPAIYLAARFRIRTRYVPRLRPTIPRLIIIPRRLKAQLSPVFASLIVPRSRGISYTPSLDTYRARTVSQSVLSRDVRELKCTLWPVCQAIIIDSETHRARGSFVVAFSRVRSGYA